VKTTNSKGSATKEVESTHPLAWQCQTAHKGGNYNYEVDCSRQPSLQFRFSTFQLPSCWSPEGYTPRTPVVDEELRHWLREELRCFSKEFHSTGIQRLMQMWKNCVYNGGFAEKCLNFVKNVTMMYANFITTVRNNTRYYFRAALGALSE
jgi:hypothetical protein